MKVLVVFYSTYGHVYKMAEAVAEGVRQVDGAEAELRRVPETLPDGVLEKNGSRRSPENVFPRAGVHGG
jgi:NAD(P)H dehydrogenase (quinone)